MGYIPSVMSDSFWPYRWQSIRLLCPWDSPGKNTAVGCRFLLQGIFPTQGLKLRLLHLLHWRVDSLPLCHLGKTVVMEGYFLFPHSVPSVFASVIPQIPHSLDSCHCIRNLEIMWGDSNHCSIFQVF